MVGIFFGKVLGLGGIVGEVVELENVVFEVLDEFPIAFADDAARGGAEDFGGGAAEIFLALEVGGEVPEDGAIREGFAVEGREEADSVEGLVDLAAGELQEGGEEVDLRNDGVVFGAFGSASGEADEEGFANAAFVEHSL